MTNREIKFELAKIALVQNLPMESVKQMYEWITEEQEDGSNSIYNANPIMEIVSHIAGTEPSNSCYPSKIKTALKNANINTVGELLNVGRRQLKDCCRNIGYGCINRIDDALDKLYGIKEW